MLRRCAFLVFLQLLTELWRGPCSKVVLRGQERPSLSLGAAPQAKTQEEFDDWLELAGSTDPQITAGLAEGFVLRYPHSEFDGRAYQMQMMAHARLDHYEP